MIKRRYYKLEHGDRDAPSESSSSSDDSELEALASESSEEEEEQEFDSVQVKEKDENDLDSSGYESEESSTHEINLDSSGVPTSDEEGPQRDGVIDSKVVTEQDDKEVVTEHDEKELVTEQKDKDLLGLPDCVVKHKSVFKCTLCPKIVCLSRQTLDAHLKSKRHARSEKLLKEGRLKHMLDNDDNIEENKSDAEDQEITPAMAFAEHNSGKSRKEKRARGQKSRSNKKPEQLTSKNGLISSKSRDKKRRYDSD